MSVDPSLAALGIGFCEWTDCGAPAAIEVDIDVYPVKLNGELVSLHSVELCRAHIREYRRTGRLNVPWERILRAREYGRMS